VTNRMMCLFGLMLLFAMLAGCVRESTSGDEHVFRYELWLSGLVFLGGVIATPAGWMLRETTSRLGWGLLILGPIAALGFAPSLLLDRVVVRPDGFSRHSGIWGMTSVQEIQFGDVKQVRAAIEEERGRRGRRIEKLYLYFDMKDASSVKMPVGNNVAEAAAPHIVENASALGINFIGLPDGDTTP
jgi:hypothetical protein